MLSIVSDCRLNRLSLLPVVLYYVTVEVSHPFFNDVWLLRYGSFYYHFTSSPPPSRYGNFYFYFISVKVFLFLDLKSNSRVYMIFFSISLKKSIFIFFRVDLRVFTFFLIFRGPLPTDFIITNKFCCYYYYRTQILREGYEKICRLNLWVVVSLCRTCKKRDIKIGERTGSKLRFNIVLWKSFISDWWGSKYRREGGEIESWYNRPSE